MELHHPGMLLIIVSDARAEGLTSASRTPFADNARQTLVALKATQSPARVRVRA